MNPKRKEEYRAKMPLDIGRENSPLVLIDYWIEAIDTSISRPCIFLFAMLLNHRFTHRRARRYMSGTSVRGYLSFISSVLLSCTFFFVTRYV